MEFTLKGIAFYLVGRYSFRDHLAIEGRGFDLHDVGMVTLGQNGDLSEEALQCYGLAKGREFTLSRPEYLDCNLAICLQVKCTFDPKNEINIFY